MKANILNKNTKEILFSKEIGEGENQTDLVSVAVKNGVDLKGACLEGARLMDRSLIEAKLSYACMNEIKLNDIDLRFSDLSHATLHRSRLLEVEMQNCLLKSVDFTGSELLLRVSFNKAKAECASFVNSRLICVDFTNSILKKAEFRSCYMAYCKFKDADLSNANFDKAYFRSTDLIDGGHRIDGHRHLGQMRDNELWIHAGCRYFPIPEARKYWHKKRYGCGLSEESLALCNSIERLARIRGMLE